MSKVQRSPPQPPRTRSTVSKKTGESRKTVTPTPSTSQITPTRRPSTPEPTSSSSTSSANSYIPEYKYSIKNIPQTHATQKTFYGLLVQLQIPFCSLKINWNRTGLLVCPTQLTSKSISSIQHTLNSPSTSFTHLGPKPKTTPALKPATYSCVVRDVDRDISPDDVTDALQQKNLQFTKATRIISRATNQPTPLFRIITADTNTIDVLISQGLPLFGLVHTCEPSHAPKPIPLQCQKCFTFGHDQNSCTKKPTCPKCSQNHRLEQCTSESTKCPACNQEHIAFSHKCPARTAAESTNNAPIAPLKPVDPPTVDASQPDQPTNIIRFITYTLLNLFPHEREKIAAVITTAALQFFGCVASVAYSGNRVHVGVL